MTIDDLAMLQTPEGTALLARVEAELGEDELPVLMRLRREVAPETAAAVVETVRLRRRARAKFADADTLFFTRDGLEMATAAPVAAHTAARFAGCARVADLCCGIGGDARALAQVAGHVLCIDRDPLVLAMAHANAGEQAARIRFLEADVTAVDLPPLDAVFIDPSRREARAAARHPEAYAPPLSWCLGLPVPRVAVKVSPALDFDAALGDLPAEVELVSLAGECKEAVLWLGGFITCASRATVLPADATLTDEGAASDAIGDVGAWLYEPDPAVIRAHLVQRLAGEAGLRRIDAEIAYLTGDAEVATPFAAAYRVREVLPWSLKRLNAALAARGVGRVMIKKRGFPLTPDELRLKLKLAGPHAATLICTRLWDGHVVVICD